MDKQMFSAGLSMIGVEFLAVLVWAIGFYFEITREIVMYSIAGIGIIAFTITGMLFMIIGAMKK